MNALDGIRVIDFTSGVAGPNCTKLLADFGADVIKVERSTGDKTRTVPPFAGDQPHAERSLLFLHLNTNKRSVTVDPATSEGADLLRRLIVDAQVVVEDFKPGRTSELGLGYEHLIKDRPNLVYCSITPWGQDGPYVERELRASELVLQGMGGPVNATGHSEREPLKLAGNLAQMQAGTVAAFAITGMVYRTEKGGEGDHLDISIYETQMGSRDRRTPALTAYSYTGATSKRTQAGFALASGVKPTQDGHINLMAMGTRRMDNFVSMIGREDLVGDERIYQQPTMLDQEFIEEIQTAYFGWLMAHGKRDAVAIAQEHGLLAGVVNTPEDLVSDPHYRERGVWESIEHPVAGAFEYPGRPVIMSDSPRPTARRAPLLGEHNAEVLGGLLDVTDEQLSTLRASGVISGDA